MRWKSPQIAAKRAERAAKEAAKLRKEKRKSRLMLIGVVLLMIAAVVADYLWLRTQARQRREQHERLHHHQPAQTYLPGTRVPTTGERTNVGKP